MEINAIWKVEDSIEGENAVEKPSHKEAAKYSSPKNRTESVSDPSVARVTPSLRPTPRSALPQHQSQRDAASQRTRERRHDQREDGDGVVVRAVLVEQRQAPHLPDAVRDEGDQHHENQQVHAHQLLSEGAAAVDPHKQQNRKENRHDLHKRKHAGDGAWEMAVGTHGNHLAGDMGVVDRGIADTQEQVVVVAFRHIKQQMGSLLVPTTK